MRKGQNPSKLGTPAYQPKPLGVAVLNYIPFEEGYFAEAWQILTYQLASLRAHTTEPYDLLVFDNGSCLEIQTRLQGLQGKGDVRWLFLSRENLGKAGALNLILGAMPNEWICYADSDVLFRHGWLEASRAIFESFPKVGLVTAQPCFFDILRGEGRAHRVLEGASGFAFGELSPPEEVAEEYGRGIGASDDEAAKLKALRLASVTNTENGTRAIVGASHMQFLAHREVLRSILPLPSRRGLDPDEDREMDLRIDRQGYLHLSTVEPFAFHMGNVIDRRLGEEVAQLSISTPVIGAKVGTPISDEGFLFRILSRLVRFPRLRWRLAWLYRTLYEVFSKA